MRKKIKKILIIGGTGFIGTNLIKYLKKKNYNIICASRRKIKKYPDLKNIKYIKADISKKKDILIKLDGDVNITGTLLVDKTTTTSENLILDTHKHPYSWTDPGGSGNTDEPTN